MSKLEEIRAILQGIDKDEVEDDRGWWETSAGAEFGASALARIERLLEAPEPSSTTMAQVIAEQGKNHLVATMAVAISKSSITDRPILSLDEEGDICIDLPKLGDELAKAGYGKLPEVGAEEEYDFGDPSPTFVSGAFVRAMDRAYAPLQPDAPKAPEAEDQHIVALGEIKARADEALAHQNADPSVDAEMAWRAVEDQARLIAALEAVQAGLSGLDEIFNGDSEDDAAIRAIVDGLRAAMAEALS